MNKKELSIKTIEKWIMDDNFEVRIAAMNACIGRNDISIEMIELGLRDKNYRVRDAAMNACIGRNDISIEMIEKWIINDYCEVRDAAMNSCIGRNDIPIEMIELGLRDKNYSVRVAAMNACKGRNDIPIEMIELGLRDKNYRVHEAAMNACKERNISFPPIRTIEPPEVVYQKCLNDVIVCAKIPKDAEIRGNFNQKCIANKAIITDIIGTFGGEQVGISIWDKTTTYFIDDKIEIEDFDYSDETCGTGFHFFCTKEEAEKF